MVAVTVTVEELGMLRLTRSTHRRGHVVLKAEGRIVGEWVRLLEEECRGLAREHDDLVLDLEAVSYLDQNAVRLLRSLASESVSLVNCPPLLEELLAEEES